MSRKGAGRRTLERQRRRRRARARLAVFVLVPAAAGGVAAGVLLSGGGAKSPVAATTRAPTVHRTTVPRVARPSTAEAAPRLRLPDPLPARTLSVPILMYHRIDVPKASLPSITRRLTVDPADFAAQMRWLKAHGYHTLTQRQLFDALEHGARLPSKPVLVTFDDGYRDVYGKAMPVLSKLRLHATAYVITSRISGPDPSFLTWGMLAKMEQRGFDIGSHTVHHVELPQAGAELASRELLDSRRALEQHLGHPVQWFAYPAGKFDSASARLVAEAGYVLAVTTRPGATQSARTPLELHRYEVLDTTGVAGLAALVGG